MEEAARRGEVVGNMWGVTGPRHVAEGTCGEMLRGNAGASRLKWYL